MLPLLNSIRNFRGEVGFEEQAGNLSEERNPPKRANWGRAPRPRAVFRTPALHLRWFSVFSIVLRQQAIISSEGTTSVERQVATTANWACAAESRPVVLRSRVTTTANWAVDTGVVHCSRPARGPRAKRFPPGCPVRNSGALPHGTPRRETDRGALSRAASKNHPLSLRGGRMFKSSSGIRPRPRCLPRDNALPPPCTELGQERAAGRFPLGEATPTRPIVERTRNLRKSLSKI